MSVSPDDGNGGRMSYLRFEDQADGVHVFFVDVADPGPFPTVAEFRETDIATLSRTRAHSIWFSINFKCGPGNDVVRINIDGRNKITGTTWEDYYRYDPEQVGNGNQVPQVDKLLFRQSGVPSPFNLGNGFLVDGVTLAVLGRFCRRGRRLRQLRAANALRVARPSRKTGPRRTTEPCAGERGSG